MKPCLYFGFIILAALRRKWFMRHSFETTICIIETKPIYETESSFVNILILKRFNSDVSAQLAGSTVTEPK